MLRYSNRIPNCVRPASPTSSEAASEFAMARRNMNTASLAANGGSRLGFAPAGLGLRAAVLTNTNARGRTLVSHHSKTTYTKTPTTKRYVRMMASSARDRDEQNDNRNDKSTSTDSTSQEGASWQEELRMLLDPSLSLSAKSILAQDMAKRAPELGQEAFDDVCNTAGLEGVPAVVEQVTKDILPDLVQNGPQYVATLGKKLPDAMADIAKAAQNGSFVPPSMPSPTGGSGTTNSGDFVEALSQELRNVFNRTPEGLETPAFDTIEDRNGYQLRRYSSMMVVETDMTSGLDGSTREVDAASAMGQSFNTLASYLFGKNSSGGALEMTTPVIIDRTSQGNNAMSFIVPSKYADSPESVPVPVDTVSDKVNVVQREGALVAAVEFTGFATSGEVGRQRKKLLDALERDGVEVVEEDGGPSYSVLIYNGPATVAFKRRNELLVKVVDRDSAQQDITVDT